MISGVLVGGEAIVARVDAMRSRFDAELRKGVARAALLVQVQIVKAKLQGQVLNVQTGRLQRSINASPVQVDGSTLFATVGTNVSYGKLWEYGFSRKVGAGARGGPHGLSALALATYQAKHPAGVKQYAARSFLRSALQEMQPKIRDEFAAAAQRAVKQ
jgi:phage gpG-like protein